MKLVEFFNCCQVSLCCEFSELSSVSTFWWHVQKIHSSGVLLYVVEMDFYGDIAFYGKFMVVWERLWSNTYPERGEAPIGFVPVPAVGAFSTRRKKGLMASGHVEAKSHTDLRKMRQDGASRLNDGGQHRSMATMVHHTQRRRAKASNNK